MNTLYYTFKTTGSNDPHDTFKLFLDNNGNIINNNDIEYGVYNKIISIDIKKLLFVKVKKIGLGDIIDFFTTITGVKKLIIYLTKGNCGCEARRIKFNSIQIPYLLVFKLRELYEMDPIVLKNNKNLFTKKLTKRTKLKDEIHTNNVISKKENLGKPLTTQEIKKSCGCNKKKLTQSKQSV